MFINSGPAVRPRGLIYDKEYTTKPNSISVYRTSDFNMYIRPPHPDRQDEPQDDFIISGVVIVHLMKPRKVKTLQVRFLAEARLAYPGEWYLAGEKTPRLTFVTPCRSTAGGRRHLST
jgi:hypothetical protein